MNPRIAALAMVTIGTAALAAPKTVGWNHEFRMGADGSHAVGNPAAKVKLVEYVSYTCPHCANFTAESDGPMMLAYISSGKVSVEIRHVLRDPVDLTVAMLTNCGPGQKFFLNHSAFMRSQSTWIQAMARASSLQKQRWTYGSLVQRNRAIANDFRFYAIMESRGYDRLTTDKCLADQAVATRIGKQSKDAYGLGVRYTPSFTINGRLLDDVSEWSELRPQLDASM